MCEEVQLSGGATLALGTPINQHHHQHHQSIGRRFQVQEIEVELAFIEQSNRPLERLVMAWGTTDDEASAASLPKTFAARIHRHSG